MTLNIYKDNVVCGTFKNLSDMKKYAKSNGVSSVNITERKNSGKIKGTLLVRFNNNISTIVNFHDLSDLYEFVGRWRNAYGCLLIIDDEPKGILNLGNYYIEEKRQLLKNG